MNITINVGNQNFISMDEILIIFSPDTKPIKRLISEAKETQRLIDLRIRSKTRSAILTRHNNIVLSSISPVTLCKNFNEQINLLNQEGVFPLKPMIHIGNDNYIPLEVLYFIETVSTTTGQRVMRTKKKVLTTYDICQDSKTRSLINLINGDVILSSVSSTMLANRYNDAIKSYVNKEPYFATIGMKNSSVNKEELE